MIIFLITILLIFCTAFFGLPNLEVELLGQKVKIFSFLGDWDVTGILINITVFGIYMLSFIVYMYIHYRIFRFIHNQGWMDEFYTEVLRLTPKTKARLDEFFKKKITARPVIQQIQQIVRTKPKAKSKITAKPAPQRATTELNDIPSI